MENNLKKLGILAGGGSLPKVLVQHCKLTGRQFHVITFRNQPQPDTVLTEDEHTEVALGAISKTLQTLRQQGVEEVVMAGNLNKPSIFDLRLDLTAAKFLKSLKNQHDNTLLSGICNLLEGEGFDVVGAHQIVPSLLTEDKAYTKVTPTFEQHQDIQLGLEAAKMLGSLDIGQAVIVKNGVVLGVEGAEGTHELIKRCAELRGKHPRGGILVKCAKPNQEQRADLPTIGSNTINQLAELKYEGVALTCGNTLILDQETLTAAADKAKLFITGVA